MSRFLTFCVFALLVTLAACGKRGNPYDSIRPNDPWVFRSVLDSMPRMITIALHDSMWIAYRTEGCGVYKAWRDGVDFIGAVYNTDHGPQPTTFGDAWFENQYVAPWFFETGGLQQAPKKVQYRGHRFEGGQVWLCYDLTTPNDIIVRVEEQPEYLAGDAGNQGLQRTFTVKDLPAGTKVGLHLNFSSILSPETIRTDGTWKLISESVPQSSDIKHTNVNGDLVLNSDKKTELKMLFVAAPMVLNVKRDAENKALAALHPGQLLVNKNDCKTCHNQDVQTVGPSYVDIAKRYPNTPDNKKMLVSKVINGGSGVWGAAAMSAHPNVKRKTSNQWSATF